jgi:hypothetical protein
MNKQKQQRENLIKYLSSYDIDDESLNLFLTFYKKDIKEKHTLYQSPTYKLPCIETDIYAYDLPYDDENYSYDDDVQPTNIPDLDFEYEMRQDFESFKSICLDDNMLDLYYNIQIDDFYRLFAPNYNPVF